MLVRRQYIQRVALINPNFVVHGQYVNAHTKILHECKVCHNKWNAYPSDVLYRGICAVCNGKRIGSAPEYKNSIWASEYKGFCAQFLTEEQMKTTMPKSEKKIMARCPDCGNLKQIAPAQLTKHGLSCICGDSISFANKFVYNVLQQLHMHIDCEYTPAWANHKRYDCYLKEYNMIIENHGLQHYEECFYPHKTLQYEQENDLLKQNLALCNGINYYIIIDCRYSTLTWIKESIMKSLLPQILQFKEEDIDWNAALQYATSSLVKIAADLYNDGLSPSEIGVKLQISKTAIWRWLKVATELKLCNYKIESSTAKKSVYCVELDITFDSIRKAAEFINLKYRKSIVLCCQGIKGTVKGYHWQYV